MRAIVVVMIVSAAFGPCEHVRADYDAGPLDVRYTERSVTMSRPGPWWVTTASVGPGPALTPAALARAALGLGPATLHHPSLARGEGILG